MTADTAPRTAPVGVAVVLVSWVLAAAALVVSVADSLDWTPVLRLVVTAVVYAPVAAVALNRQARALSTILGALAVASGLLAVIVVLGEQPGVRPAFDAVIDVLLVLARQAEIAALAVMPWLVVRRSPSLRRAGIAVGLAAIALDLSLSIARGLGADVPRALVIAPLGVAVAGLVGAAVVLAGEWRRGDERQRRQLVWFAVGAGLLVLSYGRVLVPLDGAAAAVGDAAFLAAQAMLPTAVLAFVLEGRERPNDRRLVAGIVAAQSLAVAAAVYLLVEQLLVAVTLPAPIAGAAAAAALALTVSTLNDRIRQFTLRLYFPRRVSARRVLADLAALRPATMGDDPARTVTGAIAATTTAAGPDPVSALGAIAESLRSTWRLSSVTLAAEGVDPVTSGRPGRHRLRSGLAVAGRVVGTIELTADEDDFTISVQPVLDEIEPLLAVAVMLAALNHDLEATRSRMLDVRVQERRMLHRALQDELAPSLVGLGFAMTAAARSAGAGDPGVADAIAALRVETSARAEDVRRLARSLLPVSLDSGDLDAALHELAHSFQEAGLRTVTVSSHGSDDLGPAVQVVVYLVVAEALSALAGGAGRNPGEDTAAGSAVDVDVTVVSSEPSTTVHIEAEGVASHLAGALDRAVRTRAADLGGRVRVEAVGAALSIDVELTR
ncbi:hypothetical protein N1031_19975 [Herbiconiux moechotypicola]|uniref:Signal transduction histidine kinase subgroup 3 dimerisation and phosphoacceptor domain-containing protein n=1 Tax=Herbiconiux moechotypicola TaxID=637393 RepID=A0ABN3E7S2_9MICO|nr:hypothetical protein [Herbiconiux moechotypicola]MCS5732039.1 hypothetical protein [Herbiconiux moechotypicola]